MSREPGHPAARGRRIVGPSVTGRFCAQDESARNAGETPGCGAADGAARRTRGTQTGSPPVPAGRGCRRLTCGAPAEREASAALAVPVRTRNVCARVRTHRTGSLAPRPALGRAAAACSCGHAATVGQRFLRLVLRDDQEERRRTSSPALAGRTPVRTAAAQVTAVRVPASLGCGSVRRRPASRSASTAQHEVDGTPSPLSKHRQQIRRDNCAERGRRRGSLGALGQATGGETGVIGSRHT